MTRKFLLLLAGGLLALSLGAQDAYDPDARYAPETLRQDIDILAASLKEVHPDLYQFLSEEAFDAEAGRLKAELTDSLTELQFHLKVRELIAAIRCGHTYAKPSDGWYRYFREQKQVLPFEIVLVGHKMLVSRIFSDSLPCRPGDQLLSVAGLSSGELLARMIRMQQRDGNHLGFVYRSIEDNFRTYFAFLFGSVSHVEIEYVDALGLRRQAKVACVIPGTAAIARESSPVAYALRIEGNGAWMGIPEHADSLAIIRFSEFGMRKYTGFYKKVFQEIAHRDIKVLAIDLRDCGGGYFLNGNRLLRYLKNERFSMHFHRPKGRIKKGPYLKSAFWSRATRLAFRMMPDRQKNDQRDYVMSYKPLRRRHFDKQIQVLTDGGSFSLSSNVAAMLAGQPNVTLVGEETGGGAAGTNAILSYKLILPHSGVFVSIPEFHIDNHCEEARFGRGLIPDRELERRVGDALGIGDSWMERIYGETGKE